jgi:hypothetical protein
MDYITVERREWMTSHPPPPTEYRIYAMNFAGKIL